MASRNLARGAGRPERRPHPEWRNVYHTVRIDLVTHDAGGISRKDVEVAKKLEELAARHRKSAG